MSLPSCFNKNSNNNIFIKNFMSQQVQARASISDNSLILTLSNSVPGLDTNLKAYTQLKLVSFSSKNWCTLLIRNSNHDAAKNPRNSNQGTTTKNPMGTA